MSFKQNRVKHGSPYIQASTGVLQLSLYSTSNLLTEGKRGNLTLDPDFETTSSHTSNANLWSGKCCSCMMYMYRNNIFCEKWMAKKSSLGAADHNDNKELMLS